MKRIVPKWFKSRVKQTIQKCFLQISQIQTRKSLNSLVPSSVAELLTAMHMWTAGLFTCPSTRVKVNYLSIRSRSKFWLEFKVLFAPFSHPHVNLTLSVTRHNNWFSFVCFILFGHRHWISQGHTTFHCSIMYYLIYL